MSVTLFFESMQGNPMSNPSVARVRLNTSEGAIMVELWSDVAPGHAENFLKLTRQGFYDGLGFHRILPGFVIQGGCPRGDGTGGPGWNVKAEFNDRKHDKGVLSMARSADPDSAGSQFFICLGREHCQHLDGQYTAFGKVVEGLDVVDRIAATPLADPRSGTPADAPTIVEAVIVTAD
jgi:peptidyl-prolyl cis-trans isomerase B (cyclophilin B)